MVVVFILVYFWCLGFLVVRYRFCRVFNYGVMGNFFLRFVWCVVGIVLFF